MPDISTIRTKYDAAIRDTAVVRSGAPHELKPPLPVVFYRVCDLIAPDVNRAGRIRPGNDRLGIRTEGARWEQRAAYLWDYLRSDEQAWHRFGLNGRVIAAFPKDSLTRDIKQFHVIQYFVYYMQDWGLAGHSEDIEYTFVFVPKSPVTAKSFRVVVGAGHDPPAANSVLVMVAPEAERAQYLHPNILVELGGHSSAPDMPPFGQFSAGLDVNWHIGDLWGTRDAQATSGLSYSGRYEGAMTYPRDPQDAVTLFPSGFGAGAGPGREMIADLVRVSPDNLAERSHRASHDARRLPKPISAERRRLAEQLLAAYDRAREVAESLSRSAFNKSDNVAALTYAQTQTTDTVPESGFAQAKELDREVREDSLKAIPFFRRQRARAGVDSVLSRARCLDTPRKASEAECPLWLPRDSQQIVSSRVIRMLETTNRRMPSDSVMAQLLELIPDPDSTPTAMDAIASEIRRVVIERLRPEYGLLPVRYLQAVYQGAQAGDTTLMTRHLRLITRMLHPASCDELACGMSAVEDTAEFRSDFESVVCGRWRGGRALRGTVAWDSSLACRLKPSDLDSIRLWNLDVYDRRDDGFGKSRRWPAKKHKIWEHDLYRRPELIFRTSLFRPTVLQVTNSRRAFEGLIHSGYSFHSGRASHPYVGLVIPAFHSVKVPVKVPGYLAVQAGPYFGWPYQNRATTLGLSVLYDRQFAYFYGLYLKASWVNNRSAAEAGSGASNFAWSFGASIWIPPLATVHFRPGLRFDTDGIRPLLARTVWELQLEFRR